MSTPRTITVLNGPNLNLLGQREPELYGLATLGDVERRCVAVAAAHGWAIDFRQSNHEGEIIDAIHEVRASTAGIVINAAGLTHTSVAIRDALATVTATVVEVHITNVHAREPFRHHSYVSPVATSVIAGCGALGYEFAIISIVSGTER